MNNHVFVTAWDNSIKFTIDCLPPSWNHLHHPRIHRRTGKIMIYKDDTVWRPFLQQIALQTRGVKLDGTAYSLSCLFHVSGNGKRDLDNMSKALGDALVELEVIPDDNLIVEFVLRKTSAETDKTDVFLERLS